MQIVFRVILDCDGQQQVNDYTAEKDARDALAKARARRGFFSGRIDRLVFNPTGEEYDRTITIAQSPFVVRQFYDTRGLSAWPTPAIVTKRENEK